MSDENWNEETKAPETVEPTGLEGLTVNTPVKTYAPTISSSALVVHLSISVPKLRKKDKRATMEVIARKRAAKGMATVNKKLISSGVHEAIIQLEGQIRIYHRDETIPWGDLGARLLPNVKLLDYQAQMGVYDGEFVTLTKQFLEAYPSEVSRMQMKLGDLFNNADYPSVHELERKFGLRVSFEPLPDSGDFRLDIGNQAQQELKEQYEQVMKDRYSSALNDIWKRLLEPLQNMSERLDYDDDGKPRKGHFKGTIVDNVIAIVDLMRDCNLDNDPTMDTVQRDLRNALTGVTYDRLKGSDTLRRNTKAEVDRIIENLPSVWS
jgi:hypothetical protein